jgi:recombination protein RecR
MAKNASRAERQPSTAATPPADSFERLIRELEKLPGVGRRSAERMAYALLGMSKEEAMALAYAVRDVKNNLHPCVICGDLTEKAQCSICSAPHRDSHVLCVVEWPKDLRAIEKAAQFAGRYHVLMGRLSPLSGVEPGDLRIASLIERVKTGGVREVILATTPTVEGDATANFIVAQLKAARLPVTATRLARGVPEGSDLSFAQSSTIGEALKGRTELQTR